MSNELLLRIDAMFRSLNSDAPDRGLNPSISEADIRVFESETGLVLPDRLKDIYRAFNGTSGWQGVTVMPGGFRWLPLVSASADCALGQWRIEREIARRAPEDRFLLEVQAELDAWVLDNHERCFQRVLDASRVPIAINRSGQALYIDTSPPPSGRVGQLLYVDSQAAPVAVLIADSFEEAWSRIVSAYESGAMVFDAGIGMWVSSQSRTELDVTDI